MTGLRTMRASVCTSIWIGAFLPLMLSAATSSAHCLRYTVDIIQAPQCGPGWYVGISLIDINETGDVIGGRGSCSDTGGGSFAWYGQPPIVDLQQYFTPMAGGVYALNSSRQIVGFMRPFSGTIQDRAILLQNGVVTELGWLPGHNNSEAYAINESGVICGLSRNSATGPLKAFVWNEGVMTALDLPFGNDSTAFDINNQGHVCGWMGESIATGAHAFLYRDGETTDLGLVLPGSIGATAVALNDTGAVCGYSMFEHPVEIYVRRAFLWHDGIVHDLGVLPPYVESQAVDINDAGTVIGACVKTGLISKGMIWYDGAMYALEELVPVELNLRIYSATGINNAGQIAAYGRIGSGPFVALRLNPVPPLYADTNCDWLVNHADLLQVIANWGPLPPPPGTPGSPPPPAAAADVNSDGVVNVNDLLDVINHWS